MLLTLVWDLWPTSSTDSQQIIQWFNGAIWKMLHPEVIADGPAIQSPAIITCWSHLPSLDIHLLPQPDHQGLFWPAQGFRPSGSPWWKFSSWACFAYDLCCTVWKVHWVVSERLHHKWDSSFLVPLLVQYHQRPLFVSLKTMLSPISPLNWSKQSLLNHLSIPWKRAGSLKMTILVTEEIEPHRPPTSAGLLSSLFPETGATAPPRCQISPLRLSMERCSTRLMIIGTVSSGLHTSSLSSRCHLAL